MLPGLEVLLGYVNRQVVINVYDEEELVEREGVAYERIQLEPNRIVFMRNDEKVAQLAYNDQCRFGQLPGFQHHYALKCKSRRTELYFP